ncbi:MAG: hypothetical protein DRI69_02310 [Bacteroidetes bacterium]|nr:MAG: hypothetical protein DRI69_02310 [Bacteroidota bacterium]
MYCIVEITKYPLTPDYEAPIKDFIVRLNTHDGLDITSGETSTVVRGDYDLVMSVLKDEIKVSFESGVRTAFVLKVLSTEGT